MEAAGDGCTAKMVVQEVVERAADADKSGVDAEGQEGKEKKSGSKQDDGREEEEEKGDSESEKGGKDSSDESTSSQPAAAEDSDDKSGSDDKSSSNDKSSSGDASDRSPAQRSSAQREEEAADRRRDQVDSMRAKGSADDDNSEVEPQVENGGAGARTGKRYRIPW